VCVDVCVCVCVRVFRTLRFISRPNVLRARLCF